MYKQHVLGILTFQHDPSLVDACGVKCLLVPFPSGLLQPFCLPQRKALGLKEPTIVERHGRSDVLRNMDDFNSFWPLGFRLGSR